MVNKVKDLLIKTGDKAFTASTAGVANIAKDVTSRKGFVNRQLLSKQDDIVPGVSSKTGLSRRPISLGGFVQQSTDTKIQLSPSIGQPESGRGQRAPFLTGKTKLLKSEGFRPVMDSVGQIFPVKSVFFR